MTMLLCGGGGGQDYGDDAETLMNDFRGMCKPLQPPAVVLAQYIACRLLDVSGDGEFVLVFCWQCACVGVCVVAVTESVSGCAPM
jgi:hypothetical protein